LNGSTNDFAGYTRKANDHLFMCLISISVVRRSLISLQKIGKQGGKGGDFSAKCFEKYYLDLACRLVTILGGEGSGSALELYYYDEKKTKLEFVLG